MIKSIAKKILALFGIGITAVPRRQLFGVTGLVTEKIGKYELQINKGHSLAFNIKHYPWYNQNLPRLVSFLRKAEPVFSVIDIGANVGDTVLFIRNKEDVPVLCFEGNAEYYKLLCRNVKQFDDVKIFQAYLSDKDETVSASFDFANGTLSINETAGGQEVAVITLDSVIQKHPLEFTNARVLKTDTDGYDMKILRGAWNFLQTAAPVLFLEYDRVFLGKQQEQGIDMLRKLAAIGYHRIFFYDNYGRFITSLTADQMDAVESLHDYINRYEAPFEFYDLCIFHRKDDELAKRFYEEEKLLNR